MIKLSVISRRAVQQSVSHRSLASGSQIIHSCVCPGKGGKVLDGKKRVYYNHVNAINKTDDSEE